MLFGSFGKTGKILTSWVLITAGGIFAFYVAKRDIDRHRYEHMKTRERIRHSNTGEYTGEIDYRYRFE